MMRVLKRGFNLSLLINCQKQILQKSKNATIRNQVHKAEWDSLAWIVAIPHGILTMTAWCVPSSLQEANKVRDAACVALSNSPTLANPRLNPPKVSQ
ncbi:hypothetical protein [Helicobacter sp. MIT 05-5294]|uniref:hypothetical protein n=1 Tax=Helicobacter sp. MIT 05-5294 TaxID=1548150 RepID=UPI00051FEBFE|nr:hypothetical protein [Helicobacter sp. MIT 05-5294]TLD85620.1 hypothetical protein LS69_008570 [Helicobacter sp. MIT 05-5294]